MDRDDIKDLYIVTRSLCSGRIDLEFELQSRNLFNTWRVPVNRLLFTPIPHSTEPDLFPFRKRTIFPQLVRGPYTVPPSPRKILHPFQKLVLSSSWQRGTPLDSPCTNVWTGEGSGWWRWRWERCSPQGHGRARKGSGLYWRRVPSKGVDKK